MLAGSRLDTGGGGAVDGSFGGVGTSRDAGGQTGGGTDADGSPTSFGGDAASSSLAGATVAGAADVGGMDAGGAPSGGVGGFAGGSAGGAGAGGAGAGAGAGGAGAGAAGAAQGGGTATQLELAKNKPVKASSVQAGNDAVRGNDNNLATRWCAVDGTFPQWWRVDLGAVHALSTFAVRFEHPDRQYTYQIETSQNDTVYTVQATMTGTGAVQSGSFPVNLSARYVRITITGAVAGDATHPTWGCFWEFSLIGN